MISADDLRVLLEVARTGRLTEAAKQLQINHTTVSRHITRLEQAAGTRLFDRNLDGWTLTEAGSHLLVHAEVIDAAVKSARAEVSPGGLVLAGRVRVIAPDGFGTYTLLPALGRLQHQHTDLIVEVLTANRHASLTPREFDVAVTIERPQTRALDVSKLIDFTLAFYASPDYLLSHNAIDTTEDLYDHRLIWYLDDALEHGTFNLLDEVLPNAQAQLQTNFIAGQIEAASSGLGIALLPTFIGDRCATLQRLDHIPANVQRSYWLSVPRELARLPRVRLMIEFIRSLVTEQTSRRTPSGSDRAESGR